MRKLVIGLLVAGTSLSALAQGTVFFANRVAPNIALVSDQGGAPLSGSGFYAQLFAGTVAGGEGALTAVGTPVPFRTGSVAGTWAGVGLTVPGVAGSQAALLQVRAWANNGQTIATYDAAVAAGAAAGKSAVFTSLPLGDNTVVPATLAPNIVGNPNALNNMQPFALVPEPSVIALGVLGVAGLLLRRRKA